MNKSFLDDRYHWASTNHVHGMIHVRAKAIKVWV